MIFETKLVFLHHHDVLCGMGRMNPLDTFLSLAREYSEYLGGRY